MNLMEQHIALIERLSPEAAISPACDPPTSLQSPYAPPILTFLLKRDSHLNNFHCAGASCPAPYL
jgi:hypothetical protein